MKHGKQIRLFLTDGSASGVRYAELMNWTGQAFSFPKELFDKLQEWRDETERPGVYVLVGVDETGQDAVYIGESENIAKRLLYHVWKSTLDEIFSALFFTSKDDNLTKGHITFLEQRLTKRAKEAKQYAVQFGREPSEKTLTKPETATMEEFLENIYLVSAALNYRVFDLPPKELVPSIAEASFRLELGNGVVATGYPVGGTRFVVKAGSYANANCTTSLQAGYRALKDKLREEGILMDDGDRLRFAQDYEFEASSAAAGVISGAQMSGPKYWKTLEGRTLRDIEVERAQPNDDDLEQRN